MRVTTTVPRLALILLLIWSSSTAQTYVLRTEQIDAAKGLSHDRVSSTAPTDSILWIGTDGGLDRYDGFSFREYNSANTELQSDIIRAVNIASDGSIVMITTSEEKPSVIEGLYTLDTRTDSLRRHPQFIANEASQTIISDRHFYGDKYYGIVGRTLWAFDIHRDIWTNTDLPDEFDIVALINGYVVGRCSGHWCVIRGDDPGHMMSKEDLYSTDPGMVTTLEHFDQVISVVPHVSLENIVSDSSNQVIWYYMAGKLFGLDKNESSVRFAKGDSLLVYSRKINDVKLASHGLLAVSTDDGLYLERIRPALFRSYPMIGKRALHTQPFTQSTRGMAVLGNTLYANTDDLLIRQPLDSPQVHEILIACDLGKMYAMYHTDGVLLTGRSRVYAYDLNSGEADILIDNLPPIYRPLWSMYASGDTIYLGTSSGMQVVDAEQFRKGTLQPLCTDWQNRYYKVVYQIVETHVGLIYVTSHHLYLAKDVCAPSQVHFRYRDGRIPPFANFTFLYEDHDNTFWAATMDGGVVHFQMRDSTAVVLDELNRQDGLQSNTCYAIYPDQYDNLWISTDRGLIRLNKEDWTYRVYTTEDGLPNDEFNRISYARDSRGNIYFGGLSGVVGFNPSDFNAKETRDVDIRLLHFKQFIAWDDTIKDLTSDVRHTGHVVFHPGDKFFRVAVGLDDLFRTREHQFEYKIDGMHEDWQQMAGNTVTINTLPYGHHTLRLRGKNSLGVYSDTPLILDVFARRPFYLTWWFFVILGIGILVTIRELSAARTRRIETLERLVKQRTQQIELQADDLRELQQMRSRFFANISHELRTPLTLIKAPVESLLGRNVSKEEKSYLELIQHNAHLLRERIDDLLALSKADSGQLKVEESGLRLTTFLDRLVDNYAATAQAHAIHIGLDNQVQNGVAIIADRRKLEHILSNYLSNAIKFSNNGSEVILTSKITNNTLEFSVSDQGPGIAPHDIDKVFDRFYQVVETGYDKGGTGLGLALCREFASVMHGKVWVESVTGQGSTFFLSLPYVETTLASAENEAESRSVSPEVVLEKPSLPNGQARILLVEDNTSMRDFLQNELHQYHVSGAEHGKAALDVLRKLQETELPDLIVSDVMMPEMDGFELLQEIKSDKRLSGIPVIMLTARAGVEDKLEALRIGVHDYITKPFNIEELRVRIANLLQHQTDRGEAVQEEAEGPAMDHPWLQEVEAQVMAHLTESGYSVAQLASALFLSESQLLRRLKAYTGLTPGKYLREARLYRAKEFLESGKHMTVATLSAAVGFEDPDYFSRIFMERFGYRPSERL